MKKNKMKTPANDRDSEYAFLAFVEQAGRSEAFRKIADAVEEQDHPSPDMLYDFFWERLDNAESDIVENHLDFCSVCHKELSHIRAVESELERSAFPNDEKIAWNRSLPLLSNMAVHATGLRQWIAVNPWRAVQAAGLVAVSVLFILWMGLPGASERLDKMINQSYHADYFQQIRLSKTRYDLPWETPAIGYGFASGAESTDASRAFGAGLWSGRQTIQKTETTTPIPDFLTPVRQKDAPNTKVWSNTPWNLYYQMGRWCFLIYAVSHVDHLAPPAFWEDQKKIVGQLKEVYAEAAQKGGESGGVVEASLNELASEFVELKEKNYQSTKKIAFEIRNLIIYLSHGLESDREKDASSKRF
jgi:hypothetical protein